ncbi:hypothetical protein [Ectothiorhodospira shaposhnikovii]|uniref:hypothetical protein n=1 Tax=Ectothiorhodospira shaposhnikovii TaxID=1054 RepID=UPI0039A3F3F3
MASGLVVVGTLVPLALESSRLHAGPLLPEALRTEEALTVRALVGFDLLPAQTVSELVRLRQAGIDVLPMTIGDLERLLTGAPADLPEASRRTLTVILQQMQDTLGLAEGAGEAAPVPAFVSLPALPMPPSFPLEQMGETHYTALISIAMEGTRAMMGPMSSADEARFEAYWKPYFDFPDASIIAYFKAAIPLLSEFVVLRQAQAKAAEAFDDAWEEAMLAAAYDSEADTRAALNLALMQQDYMRALQARMDDVTRAMDALGDPPDPVEQKAEAARRHQSAIDAILEALPPDAPHEGLWVGQGGVAGSMVMDELPGFPVLFLVYAVGDRDDPEYRAFFLGEPDEEEGIHEYVQILPMRDGEHAFIPGLFHGFSRGHFHAEFEDEDGEDTLIIQARQLTDPNQAVVYPSDIDSAAFERAYRQKMAALAREREALVAAEGGDPVENAARLVGAHAGLAVAEAITTAYVNMARTTFALTPAFQRASREWLSQRPWSEDSSLEEDLRQFNALFDRHAAGVTVATGDAPGPRPSAPPVAQSSEEAARQQAELAEAQAEAERKQARIKTHEHNITMIGHYLRREQEELAVETDPERRAALEFRIITRMADLQSEQDLIDSIRTGTLVRTRSVFDDYAHQGFIENIRQSQRQMEDFTRGVDALYRLSGMLPDHEREQARRFIENQLTPEVRQKMDQDVVQRMASAIGQQVRGFHELEQARAEEELAWHQYKVETAETLQAAANRSMMVASLFGGRPANLAYQGITGYIQGGPREAMLQTAAYMGPKVNAAAEAVRGYQEDGLMEGVRRGAVSFATSKAMEYGFSKLLGGGAGTRQQTQGASGAGQRPMALPSAADRQAQAEFHRARAEGERLVREFQASQQQLLAAGRAGRSASEITLLQNMVRNKAAAINGNPSAKNFLKYQGAYGTQAAYNAHLKSIHAEVEAGFHAGMGSRGWNRQPLREFRNAASAGSVGMDYDIGLDEALVRSLQKGGRPAGVHEWQRDAQRAWDEAYRKVTGRSAQQAWENVTTSVHPESYRDVAWLSSNRRNISRAWGQQAADVTRYKSWHMLNDPSLSHFERLQEVSRGAAKDFAKIGRVTAASPASAEALRQSRNHWGEVVRVLEDFGNNTLDPLEANRRIHQLTGGKSIPDVVEDMAMLMESITRFGPR